GGRAWPMALLAWPSTSSGISAAALAARPRRPPSSWPAWHETAMAEPVGLLEVMAVLGMTGESWSAWHTLAKCMDGRPLAASEMPLFESCTGRSRPPTEPPDEGVVVVSRRGGKSRIAGAKAVQVAGFKDYR